MRIGFDSPFAPDVAELDQEVLAVAKNALPVANGFIPFPGPAVYSGALSAAPKGGPWAALKIDGSVEVYAGTATTLEELVSLTWTDRSGATTFACPSNEFWQAAQFGTNLICTNYVDGPYVLNVQSGTNFAALGGSPPTGRSIGVVEGHVFLGSTDDDEYGVAWSDTNDATNWSTGNASTQTFAEGGRPMAICSAAGIIIQERAIQQVVFSPGQSPAFQFEQLEGSKGTIAPNSVIQYGPDVAYIADDGPWFRGEPIGHQKVARELFQRADAEQLYTIQGIADPYRPVFYWIWRSDSSDTTYTDGFGYNWHLNKWFELEFDLELIGWAATSGISPDSWSNSPDSESLSPDSRAWAGGSIALAGFDSDNKLVFFDGANLEATWETGERTIGDMVAAMMQRSGNRRAMVRGARPFIDTSSATMNIRKRQRMADTGSWMGTDVAMSSAGMCYFHRSGRLFRFRVNVPSGTTWSFMSGLDVDAKMGGVK